MPASKSHSTDAAIPGRVERHTALTTTNTVYVIFLGLMFSLLFTRTAAPAPDMFLITSLPILSAVYCGIITIYLLALWLCDNFYVSLPQSISDILLIANFLRISAFGGVFALAIYRCPAMYLAFGLAGIIEGVVHYFIYADVMRPLFTSAGRDWLQEYVREATPNKTFAAWVVRGVATPRLVALILTAVRLLLAVGVVFFSFYATISGDDLEGQTLWATYFCIGTYVVIQLAVWFSVIRKDLGRQYAEAFREFEKSRDATISESKATQTDGGSET